LRELFGRQSSHNSSPGSLWEASKQGSNFVKKGQHSPGLSVSESEAKGTVEEKLRKQQLTKPLTEKEMIAFCDRMSRYFEFDSKTDGPAKIRAGSNPGR
jgi:hypothetical protein